MNLTSPREVGERMRQLGLEPNPLLGQNFLIDANIRNQILNTSGAGAGDTVLEIGPGLGVLTEGLLERGAKVVAVEKDSVLYAHLQEHLGANPRLELIRADFLDLDPTRWSRSAISQVVANLPYSSGSRMIVELAQLIDPPIALTLTVQLEVAERLAAGPGGRQRGLLGVLVQRWYTVRIVKTISGACFFPAPEVRSAIVRLDRIDLQPAEGVRLALFCRVAKAAFSQRRKQIRVILGRVEVSGYLPLDAVGVERILAGAGIKPQSRPEELTVGQWDALAGQLMEESHRDT
jgi:16S rRNA (adenine1518-N6/adenine1519-N6)-dimethyltransferase